jgi:hypothetical protein
MKSALFGRFARLRGQTHSAVAVNFGQPNSHTEVVSVVSDEKSKEQHKEQEGLSEEELERQDGEPLPERTQMSMIAPVQGWHIEPLPVPPVDEA